MDVTCERCHTRYEFEEALVSSRGTTVKCTQCGHQFRVYRPAGASGLSGWTVRCVDGRELYFEQMRELQGAIAARDIGEDDVLVPDDGSEPRRLGRIEELRTFLEQPESLEEAEFDTERRGQAGDGPPQSPPRMSMQDREGRPLPARTGDTLPPPTPSSIPTQQRQRISDLRSAQLQKSHARQAERAGERVGRATSVHIPRAARMPSFDPALAATEPDAAPRERRPRPAPAAMATTRIGVGMPSEEQEAEEALERASDIIRRSQPPPAVEESVDDGLTEEVLRMPPGYSYPPSDPAEISSMPLSPSPSATRPSVLRRSDTTDPRFSEYSRRGRPGIGRWIVGVVVVGLVALVGVTAVKKLAGPPKNAAGRAEDARIGKLLGEGDRLLGDGDLDGAKEQYAKASGIAENDPRVLRSLARVSIVQADRLWLRGRIDGKDPEALAKAVERAAQEVDAAVKAGDGPETAALQLDSLRLQGKLSQARRFVTKLEPSDPNGARALATLDLCEPDPSWDVIIDRLRSAALAEKKLGQARSTLVYALAERGDPDAAQRELDQLAVLSPSFPLLDPLRELVARTKPSVDLDAPGKSASRPAAAPAAPGAGEAPKREADSPGSDIDKLKDNPDYVPGQVALADQKWASGDRAGALELYRQVVLNAPGTPYADHANERLHEGAAPTEGTGPRPAPSAASSAAPSPKATSTPAAPPPPPPPAIDTSDLK